MTALTSALALIPLALGGDLPGNEIQSPMAKVILGGLLTSTLLNGFIIPIVYLLINKQRAWYMNKKYLFLPIFLFTISYGLEGWAQEKGINAILQQIEANNKALQADKERVSYQKLENKSSRL